MEGIETEAKDAAVRLAARFPELAVRAGGAPGAPPLDRAAASALLEAVQLRHNAETALLATLREQASRSPQGPPAQAASPASWKARAAALWRNLQTRD